MSMKQEMIETREYGGGSTRIERVTIDGDNRYFAERFKHVDRKEFFYGIYLCVSD